MNSQTDERSSHSRSPRRQEVQSNFRIAIVGTAALALATLYIATPYLQDLLQLPDVALEALEHGVLLLAIAFGIHALERAAYWREVLEAVNDVVDEVYAARDKVAAGADKAGIVAIANNRQKECEEVRKAIEGSEQRVWLLGVALRQDLHVDDIVRSLAAKYRDERQDIRVLLMDPTRSPAAFRMLLEGDPEVTRRIYDLAEQESYRGQGDVCQSEFVQGCV